MRRGTQKSNAPAGTGASWNCRARTAIMNKDIAMDCNKNTPLVPAAQGLSDAHWHMLTEGSGIAPDVVEQRGYRTATGYSELKSLGFKLRRDTETKGLLLPLYTPQGTPIQTYIAKEDRSP